MTADQPVAWSIELARSAKKDFRRFRSVQEALDGKLSVLTTRPEAGEPLTGALTGARSLKFSLPGMGECRVAYIVLANRRILLLFCASTRENFYREAQRRYEALLDRGDVDIDED